VSRRTAVALIAAAFIVGGGSGALAASHYLITSTKQIAPSVLRELRGAKGTRGPAGATGETGATGAVGATGLTSESEVTGAIVTLSEDSPVGESTASCPTDQLVLSGGWAGSLFEADVAASEPTTVNGQASWAVIATLDPGETNEETFKAIAVCGAQ
jgi:hypothetical protein